MPEDTDRPMRVFLCHTSKDKPVIRKLYRFLRKNGIDAWLDEHGMTLPFDKKMLVLRHLVEHAHESGAVPDTTTMAQILRIAA